MLQALYSCPDPYQLGFSAHMQRKDSDTKLESKCVLSYSELATQITVWDPEKASALLKQSFQNPSGKQTPAQSHLDWRVPSREVANWLCSPDSCPELGNHGGVGDRVTQGVGNGVTQGQQDSKKEERRLEASLYWDFLWSLTQSQDN